MVTNFKIMAKTVSNIIALKECALQMNIDLNSLPKLTEFTLLQALKTKVYSDITEPIPFDELENKSLSFKINYAHYFGVSKEEICERLNTTRQYVRDVLWYYSNKSYRQKKTYKEKIEEYLLSNKKTA